MELRILSVLDWKVNPPTCSRFLSSYLLLCPKLSPEVHPTTPSTAVLRIYEAARYLTELSLCTGSYPFRHSVTAFSALLCAMEATASPLPGHITNAFLRNVAEAVDLRPDENDVLQACPMIKSLCPTMFLRESSREGLNQASTGSTSPVSVVSDSRDLPDSYLPTKR